MWATDKRVLAKWPQLRLSAHIVPADEENLEPLPEATKDGRSKAGLRRMQEDRRTSRREAQGAEEEDCSLDARMLEDEGSQIDHGGNTSAQPRRWLDGSFQACLTTGSASACSNAAPEYRHLHLVVLGSF